MLNKAVLLASAFKPAVSNTPTFPGYSVTETIFGSATTTHNVNIPAVSTGDGLICIFQASGAGAINEPGAWTPRDESANGGIFVRRATAASGATTENFSTNNAVTACAQVYRITNWFDDLAGIEVSAAASATSAFPDPSAVVATWGSALNLFIATCRAIDDNETVVSAPANYVNLVSTVSGGGLNNGNTIGSAARELEAASDDPSAFILSATEIWAAQTIVVRPAV